jgi:hypothetical protein
MHPFGKLATHKLDVFPDVQPAAEKIETAQLTYKTVNQPAPAFVVHRAGVDVHFFIVQKELFIKLFPFP